MIDKTWLQKVNKISWGYIFSNNFFTILRGDACKLKSN